MMVVFGLQGLSAAVAGTWQMKVGMRSSMLFAGCCFGFGHMFGGARCARACVRVTRPALRIGATVYLFFCRCACARVCCPWRGGGAALGVMMHSKALLYGGYGLLGGCGVGIAYTPPLGALLQWFPGMLCQSSETRFKTSTRPSAAVCYSTIYKYDTDYRQLGGRLPRDARLAIA